MSDPAAEGVNATSQARPGGTRTGSRCQSTGWRSSPRWCCSLITVAAVRWNRNIAETLAHTAQESGEPAEELLLKAVTGNRRYELLARALSIAQNTALRDKRRALRRAFAKGITTADWQVSRQAHNVTTEGHRILARLRP